MVGGQAYLQHVLTNVSQFAAAIASQLVAVITPQQALTYFTPRDGAQPYQFRLASRRPSNWVDSADEDGVQYTLGAAAKRAAVNDDDSGAPDLVRSCLGG